MILVTFNCFLGKKHIDPYLFSGYTLHGHNLSFVEMLKAECQQGIKLFFMFQMSIIQTSRDS